MELPTKYPIEHYQQKADRYARALRLLGVSVDETTKQRWTDLISMARSIDTYLDEGPRNLVEHRTRHVLNYLQKPQEIATRHPALAPEKLGFRAYKEVRRLGSLVVTTSLQTKTAPSLGEYANLRRQEGRHYADLISAVATPEVAAQPAYRRFVRWLRPVGEVTNLVNSMLDLPEDYQAGEISFTPGATTRLQLLGHTALAIIQAPRTADFVDADEIN